MKKLMIALMMMFSVNAMASVESGPTRHDKLPTEVLDAINMPRFAAPALIDASLYSACGAYAKLRGNTQLANNFYIKGNEAANWLVVEAGYSKRSFYESASKMRTAFLAEFNSSKGTMRCFL